MGDRTAIEWTDASWNPIRARSKATGKVGWHCTHVSEGCRNCYSESLNMRLGTGLAYKPGHAADIEVFLDEKMLLQPLRWRRPRMIFLGSMTDVFADFVTDVMFDRIFAVMALCPHHTFQLLTKRPERMRAYLSHPDHAVRWFRIIDDEWAMAHQDLSFERVTPNTSLRNVWLGTSCEDQAAADLRVPDLLATPASTRFVSAEPLLGPIDFQWIAEPDDEADGVIDALLGCNWIDGRGRGVAYTPARPGHQDRAMTREVVEVRTTKLDWIIVGGESGPHARPMHPAWARSIRDQCAAAGVAFHFKQHGEWVRHTPVAGGDLGGDVRRGRVAVVHPTGEDDVAISRRTGGRSTIPGTCYVERVGKKAAGRLLDGVTHNGMPEVHAHG